MTGPSPDISVVIPYFDAPRQLALVLAGLDAQRLAPSRFEVVVADDGSPVPPRPGHHEYDVRVVDQPDLGFRAAAARNLGAAASGGRLLCFLDGDTVPEPDYLTATLTAADELGAVVLVGRRRHADLAESTPVQVRRWLRGDAGVAPRELPAPRWLSDAYRRTDDLRNADDESYRFVISAVMSMPRELFDAVGGFDERFVAYGGEDWELANRCWLAGAALRHVPGAVAWHDGPGFAGRDIDQQDMMDAQSMVLARLLPSPAHRPPGLVWRYPLVVVEVDDGGWRDIETTRCVAGLLRETDAGVWLADGHAAAPGGPLSEDPRVHVGAPPPDVRARCRYVARVTRPVDALRPGWHTDDSPTTEAMRVRHARGLRYAVAG